MGRPSVKYVGYRERWLERRELVRSERIVA